MEAVMDKLFEKIRLYSELSEVTLSTNVSLTNGVSVMEIEMSQKSSNVIEDLKTVIFILKEITVTNLDDLVYIVKNKIFVDIESYTHFYNVYKALKKFEASVLFVKIGHEYLEFVFELENRHDLTANQLRTIQKIVNPHIPEHRSIRVSYSKGMSKMSINLKY